MFDSQAKEDAWDYDFYLLWDDVLPEKGWFPYPLGKQDGNHEPECLHG